MTDKRPQQTTPVPPVPPAPPVRELSQPREFIKGERHVEKYGQQTHNSENDPRGSGSGQTRDKEGG